MAKGRPREFQAQAALDRALKVFWRKGYEGASLADLTAAMKINRPSLYAAFGNKEALFRRALDRYAEGPAVYFREALEAPTARRVMQKLLRGTVDRVTSPRNPRGCLIVQGALSCSRQSDSVRKELIARRHTAERAIRKRFHRARSEGDLPGNSKPADLARYVNTLIHGLSVQAAGGAKRNELMRVVRAALRNFPM